MTLSQITYMSDGAVLRRIGPVKLWTYGGFWILKCGRLKLGGFGWQPTDVKWGA